VAQPASNGSMATANRKRCGKLEFAHFIECSHRSRIVAVGKEDYSSSRLSSHVLSDRFRFFGFFFWHFFRNRPKMQLSIELPPGFLIALYRRTTDPNTEY
jgi:hypothetical protein